MLIYHQDVRRQDFNAIVGEVGWEGSIVINEIGESSERYNTRRLQRTWEKKVERGKRGPVELGNVTPLKCNNPTSSGVYAMNDKISFSLPKSGSLSSSINLRNRSISPSMAPAPYHRPPHFSSSSYLSGTIFLVML